MPSHLHTSNRERVLCPPRKELHHWPALSLATAYWNFDTWRHTYPFTMFSRIKTALSDRTNRHDRDGEDELEDYKKELDDLPGYPESSGSEIAKEQVLESDSSGRQSCGSLDVFGDAILIPDPNRPSREDVQSNEHGKIWWMAQYGFHSHLSLIHI